MAEDKAPGAELALSPPRGIPIQYNFNYSRAIAVNQFDVSPDGRHLAFQPEAVLEEHLGMIENVR
jgi:hypothetical protein